MKKKTPQVTQELRLKSILIDFLLIVIPVALILTFARRLLLVDPPVWPDEPIFFDVARNFLSFGQLKTEIYGSILPQLQDQSLLYPPFYFLILGGWIKIFGEHIEIIRNLSVLLGIISIIIFYFLLKKVFLRRIWAFLGTLLLATNYNFLRSTHIGRMEILVLVTLLSSFTILLHLRGTKGYLLSGLAAALALLTHPLGIITHVVLLSYVLVMKLHVREKLGTLFLIFIPTLVLSAWWFSYIWGSLESMVKRLTLQLALRNNPAIPHELLLFYTNSQHKLFLMLFALLIILLTIISIAKHKSHYLAIITGSLVSFGLAIYGKEMWYSVYYEPFFILSIITVLSIASHFHNRLYLLFLLIVLAFPVWLNLSNISEQLKKDYEYDYHFFSRAIAQNISPNSTVCLSTIPDPYFNLRTEGNLKLREFIYSPTLISETLKSCDYLVMNFFNFDNGIVSNYVAKNTKRIINIGLPGQYSTTIFQFR